MAQDLKQFCGCIPSQGIFCIEGNFLLHYLDWCRNHPLPPPAPDVRWLKEGEFRPRPNYRQDPVRQKDGRLITAEHAVFRHLNGKF